MRPFVLGVATVFVTAAATVILRAYADAVFLDTYGAGFLPELFMTQAFAFAALTAGYAAARDRDGLLDLGVLAALGGLALASPSIAGARGGRSLDVFAVALGLTAFSSVATLAAWNLVARTASGREARRLMPRAGAAVTAGGVIAGFGASAFIARFGLGRLPLLAAALMVVVLVTGAATRAALRRGSPPDVVPASPAGEPSALLGWLVAATLLEAVLNTLIDFRFKADLRAAIGGDRLGVILAAFMGASNSLLLLLQIFAVPRLVVSTSLPVSSAIHPLSVAAVLSAGLALPSLLAAGAARAADSVLRAATGRAAGDVAMSPLADAPRERWKLLLRGLVIPLGGAAAGVALLAAPAAAWAALPVALALFLVWRRVARAFHVLLAAPLGVRTVAAPGELVDLDATRRLVERCASSDEAEARLARAALERAGHAVEELLAHLEHPNARVREVVFALAARRPSPAAVTELRAAVAVENDPAALAAGLRALGEHGDDSAVARARTLRRSPGSLGRAAAAYLAQLGRLPAAEAAAAARAVDPVWAAAVVAGARLDGDFGLRADVAAGRLDGWLARLAAGDAEAARALEGLDVPPGLRGRELSASSWARVVAAARRALPSPERAALLEELLAHRAPAVREAAQRALAHATVEQDAVERALEVELDGVELLRAAAAPPGTLLAGELAAHNRRGLRRALAIAALALAPDRRAPMRAAARRAAAGSQAALDLVQEVAVVGRARLTAALERSPAPPRGDGEALAAAARLDPWIARILTGELDRLEPRLRALRARFPDAPGEALLEVAEGEASAETHPDLALARARELATEASGSRGARGLS